MTKLRCLMCIIGKNFTEVHRFPHYAAHTSSMFNGHNFCRMYICNKFLDHEITCNKHNIKVHLCKDPEPEISKTS